MTKTRSQKLNVVQKTNLAKQFGHKFVKRAMGVAVKLDRINFANFHCEKIAHCFIQLDRKKFERKGKRLNTVNKLIP